MSNQYLQKAKTVFDKIDNTPETLAKVEQFVSGNNPAGFQLSGLTQNPIVEVSSFSQMEDEG